MTTEEAYRILGLARGATAQDVKEAYRKAALEVHPDHARGYGLARPKDFLRVRDAYEFLRSEGFPELPPEAPPLAPKESKPKGYQAPPWLAARWEKGSQESLSDHLSLDDDERTGLKKVVLLIIGVALLTLTLKKGCERLRDVERIGADRGVRVR